MKFPRILTGLVVAGLIFSSCYDDSNEPSIEQLSSFAKEYIGMNFGNSASSFSMNNASGNMANESFNRLYNKASIAGGRKGEDSDTTIYEDPWQWQTCATITTTENEDKSTTMVVDYGDGCYDGNDFYQYWTHGKYSYTNRFSSEQNGSVFTDEYLYNYIAENYGGTYAYAEDTASWVSDGFSNYSGFSTYNQDDNTYNGRFSFDHDFVSAWGDQYYTSKGHGINSYNENKNIFEEGDNSYTQPDGSYYRSTVLTPLVQRWDCYSYWADTFAAKENNIAYCWFPVYVSGRQLIRYKQGDAEGSFIIDYGDGSCDSEITIIENNQSVALDLSRKEITRQMK